MSPCFPYPPPGFKPKLTTGHADLLHKEKHKDKKHKKDKKDKQESKEKGEKDEHHSKDKHRDSYKDKEEDKRKEKHKHNNKEKERDKESDKDMYGTQSVPLQLPTKKISEDSRILSEHSKRVDEGPQAGCGGQFVGKRVAATGTSVHGKSNDAMKVGPPYQSTNHRATIAVERRVPGMPSTSSPEEGINAKKTVSSPLNSSVMNSNSLMQRKSNDPSKNITNNHGTNFTVRRVVGRVVPQTLLS